MDQVSRSFETQEPPLHLGGHPIFAMPEDPPVEQPPTKSGGYPLKPVKLPEQEPPVEPASGGN